MPKGDFARVVTEDLTTSRGNYLCGFLKKWKRGPDCSKRAECVFLSMEAMVVLAASAK